MGEYVLTNSNLNTSMVRVGLEPAGSIHVNIFYYHHELDDAAAFGVSSDSYADDWYYLMLYTSFSFK